MKEKEFNKTYDLCAPQATFTRVANRMLKEYKEVHGTPDDEITKIAEQIKKCEEVEFDYDHSYDVYGNGLMAYDKCRMTYDDFIHCGFDSDEYGDPYYYVHWYFFESEWYTKRVGEQELHAGDYSTIHTKVELAKGEYRYFCTHRPPASYCLPDGYVSYDAYPQGQRYIGEATYNRELTREECNNWGLRLDDDWARYREAIRLNAERANEQ